MNHFTRVLPKRVASLSAVHQWNKSTPSSILRFMGFIHPTFDFTTCPYAAHGASQIDSALDHGGKLRAYHAWACVVRSSNTFPCPAAWHRRLACRERERANLDCWFAYVVKSMVMPNVRSHAHTYAARSCAVMLTFFGSARVNMAIERMSNWCRWPGRLRHVGMVCLMSALARAQCTKD